MGIGNILAAPTPFQIDILKDILQNEEEGINIREAEEAYSRDNLFDLMRDGWLSLLCRTVVIDDAFYALTPRGMEEIHKYI